MHTQSDIYVFYYLYYALVISFPLSYIAICSQATSGAGTAYPSGAPEFTPGF
jgi:hypothetical protein